MIGLGFAWKNAESKQVVSAPSAISGGLRDPAARSRTLSAPYVDTRADGFPDIVRFKGNDRDNFVRWMTFVGESQYYREGQAARSEISDCAAFIRFALRNALVPHDARWRRSLELPFDPGFADVTAFQYPGWPLGRGLFRTRPGPFASADLTNGAFAEFADSQAFMRYNSFFISRDWRAAERGDLLFYYQPNSAEPYHSMLFVGRSFFQPRGSDWMVYHTGELDGGPGEIRELEASVLLEHPDPRWRPRAENPHFLGVYRLDLLH